MEFSTALLRGDAGLKEKGDTALHLDYGANNA
jgi:hypothetical protein